MSNPRNTPPRRDLGIWPLVVGAAVLIALAVWVFTRGEVSAPRPLPDSPAAIGTAGEPAGVTGDTPRPGAPVGADAPPGSPTVPARP